MNEQLTVKNFGPIKDATVDFKRVTVFIGPTGGGKSTLAKLAAIYNDHVLKKINDNEIANKRYSDLINKYDLLNFDNKSTKINFAFSAGNLKFANNIFSSETDKERVGESPEEFMVRLMDENELDKFANVLNKNPETMNIFYNNFIRRLKDNGLLDDFFSTYPNSPHTSYIPAERIFASSVSDSLAGLIANKVALPESLLEFINEFEIARKNELVFTLPFNEDIKYTYKQGLNTISIGKNKKIPLSQSASGIQASVPMLLTIENNSKQVRPVQYIIEEPELNLYPITQSKILEWLIIRCTTGVDRLIINTHSPYILSHLNLLLYAYQVAEKHPERKEEVAAIVPEASWINPKEFACYQVENGGVESLVNEDLGLIDDNGLDNLSGDAADAFDNLIRLSKSVAVK